MTAADVPLVEVAICVGPEQAELAEFSIGEFSPGGFQHEPQEDGGARFAVFVPAGDEGRVEAWLAGAGIAIEGTPVVTPVPGDWAERWKEFHQAVVIGSLWVGPPWQVADAPAGLKQVVIEPAQGFGTGAHPTTRLVLALLQDQPRASILDLGCGSGVLAVAAAKLGFRPIIAVDNDPVAVENTIENLVHNDVESLVQTRVLDALREDLPRADIVLANVLLEPLVRIAPRMTAPRLVLSGLLRSQVDECVAAYEAVGYVLRERRDRDGWAAIVLEDAREHAEPMRHRAVW
ncbi:MAG: ribosomal methyltransferase [Thermoleophilia bacterium]|nr:ribosomal methyltransferase [Thermoleophilia bacterium]